MQSSTAAGNGASGARRYSTEDFAARPVRKLAAECVVRVDIADRPPAAVKVDERRQHFVFLRCAIGADRYAFRREQQAGPALRHAFRRNRGAALAIQAPRDERRLCPAWEAGARCRLEQRLHLRMRLHFTAASIFFRRSTKKGAFHDARLLRLHERPRLRQVRLPCRVGLHGRAALVALIEALVGPKVYHHVETAHFGEVVAHHVRQVLQLNCHPDSW